MKANKRKPTEGEDEKPHVEFDRSDEDAAEALQSMGPVNTETATRDELAERMAYLEELLDVHGEGLDLPGRGGPER
jgi:hypothetical protein